MTTFSISDYLLITILMGLLLLANMFEYFITNQNHKDSRGKSLIKGAGWIFLGILLTLILGFVAQLKVDQKNVISPKISFWFMTVPIALIVHWAIHYKMNSKLLYWPLIKTHVNFLYKEKIVDILNTPDSKYLTENEILQKFKLNHSFVNDYYRKIFGKGLMFPFLPSRKRFVALFEPYLMTEDKLTILLGEMKGKQIELLNDGTYYANPNWDQSSFDSDLD